MPEEQVLVQFDVPSATYFDGRPNYLLGSHCTLTDRRLVVQGSREGTRQIILQDVSSVVPDKSIFYRKKIIVRAGQLAALHLGATDAAQADDIFRWLNSAMVPGGWTGGDAESGALPQPGSHDAVRSTPVRSEVIAGTALVLGLLSVLTLSVGGGFLLGVPAVVLGLIAWRRTDPDRSASRRRPFTAIALGVAAVLAQLVAVFGGAWP